MIEMAIEKEEGVVGVEERSRGRRPRWRRMEVRGQRSGPGNFHLHDATVLVVGRWGAGGGTAGQGTGECRVG